MFKQNITHPEVEHSLWADYYRKKIAECDAMKSEHPTHTKELEDLKRYWGRVLARLVSQEQR